MEFLEFAFQSPHYFLGVVILIGMVGMIIEEIFAGVVKVIQSFRVK